MAMVDQDNDGYPIMYDCHDNDPNIHPGAAPVCYLGYDANCNGVADVAEPPCNSGSPVVLDLEGDGIALTSMEGGVQFDLDADGIREKLSWTIEGTDDAWLALDRNGNGTMDDGKELFGNYTLQPEPPEGSERNGLLALASFDAPENGGNHNGAIDPGDRAYDDLLLWQDSNHNGESEPDELRTLRSYGSIEISLDYQLSKTVDELGNQFRYRAKLKLGDAQPIGKWAWDVFLLR